MGLLVDGHWHDRWYDTDATEGRFVRSDSQFRHWITAEGCSGPDGSSGFVAEPNRYHLYVSLACPWAHRTLIFRALKGLEKIIPVSVVNPLMQKHGWTFADAAGVTGDSLYQSAYLYQLYTRADANYSGRVTVPVLWDRQQQTIVSNESAEIIRMFNSAFDQLGAKPGDYYPQDLRGEIDALNEWIYDTVNNGVYKAGFATTQHAYEAAVFPLFATLEKLEQRLAKNRYLLGDILTEADWRLFTTLIRFDAVYHGHFKCNLRTLESFANISAYVRELFQWPGVAATVNFEHIKQHYYQSHTMINPTGVVPVGPLADFSRPHHRDLLGKHLNL